MSKLRYIRYSRKSSEAKDRQAASINDQNTECEEYAIKKKLNIIYRLQESKSAYKPRKREVFDEMFQLIKNGKADAIITWKPDRLSRNPEEGGMILQLLQDGVLKEIRTPSGNVYNPDSDHLILQIHFGMANQYSRNLSQTVKRALKHKVERGEYPGNAFVGYVTFGDKGSKNIKPHPIEATLVKKTFLLTATGQYSLANISNFLYAKGITARSGRKFSKGQTHRMLTNTSYYGYFMYNGEMYKGTYKPIITKKLFDEAQDGLRDRSKPKVNTWRKASYNGLFKCPDCGSAITTTVKIKHYKGTNRTAKFVYLHCTKRRDVCTQPPISLEDFESKLLEKILGISIDKDVWNVGMKLLKEKNKEEINRNTKQMDKFHEKYKLLQLKLNGLIQMRANGELTKKEFMIQKELTLKEQASAEGLMQDVKQSAHDWIELAEEFLNNAFYARKVMSTGKMTEKRNLLMDIGENFLLKDKNLKFSFKMPYDVLLKPEVRTDGRG